MPDEKAGTIFTIEVEKKRDRVIAKCIDMNSSGEGIDLPTALKAAGGSMIATATFLVTRKIEDDQRYRLAKLVKGISTHSWEVFLKMLGSAVELRTLAKIGTIIIRITEHQLSVESITIDQKAC